VFDAGYNVCLFAYGQTGSGKTYSMYGEKESEGLVIRSSHAIFDDVVEKARKEGIDVQVETSYVEIYNEKLRDLLDPTSDPV
jgi:kinesin family member 1